jgi:hypothetical protein
MKSSPILPAISTDEIVVAQHYAKDHHKFHARRILLGCANNSDMQNFLDCFPEGVNVEARESREPTQAPLASLETRMSLLSLADLFNEEA